MDTKREEIRVHKEVIFKKIEYVVSVDQLHSDQTVLVPQLSGKLTSARIWSAQVMVGHFSD